MSSFVGNEFDRSSCSFLAFDYFLVNFGAFQRISKNQDIQEHDPILTSYDVTSSMERVLDVPLPSKFRCHSFNMV